MGIFRALAEKRVSLGIPKIQLAHVLHMTVYDITLAERGNPKAHTLEKVCEWAEALGMVVQVSNKG